MIISSVIRDCIKTNYEFLLFNNIECVEEEEEIYPLLDEELEYNIINSNTSDDEINKMIMLYLEKPMLVNIFYHYSDLDNFMGLMDYDTK